MKLKAYLIKLIEFYRRYINFFKKPSCVFYPTCSLYARQAVEKYGVLKGVRLSFFRILRCHPWQRNHLDPLK